MALYVQYGKKVLLYNVQSDIQHLSKLIPVENFTMTPGIKLVIETIFPTHLGA